MRNAADSPADLHHKVTINMPYLLISLMWKDSVSCKSDLLKKRILKKEFEVLFQAMFLI